MKLEELIARYQLPVDVVRFCLSNGLSNLSAIEFHEAAYNTFSDLPGWSIAIEHQLLDLLTTERIRREQHAGLGPQADSRDHASSTGSMDPPDGPGIRTDVRPSPADPGLEQLAVLFGLSVRAFNVCESAGLHTLSMIRAFALEHGGFKKLRNCGAKTQMELSDLLNRSAAAGYTPDKVVQPYGAVDPDRMEAICTAQYLKLSTRARNILQSHIGHPTAEAIIRFSMQQGRKMPKLPGAGGKVMRELRTMRERTMSALTDRSVEWPADSDPRSLLLKWAACHQVEPGLLPSLQQSDGRLTLLKFLERYLSEEWNGSKLNVYRTQLLHQGPMLTLEAIAESVGLTRERVRQRMVKMDQTVMAHLGMLSDLPGVREQYPELVCTERCMIVDDDLVHALNAREDTTCSQLLIAYIIMVLNSPRLQLVKWADLFDRSALSREMDQARPLLLERELVEELKGGFRQVVRVVDEIRSIPERRPLAEILSAGDKAPSNTILPLLCKILPMRYPGLVIEDGYIGLPANAKRSQEEMLEEVLAVLDEPSHVTRVQEVWNTRFPDRPITVGGIRSVVVRNKSLFFSIGRESTYGLRRWEKERDDLKSGTIRDIVEDLLQWSPDPIHLEDLVEGVQKFRTGTYLESVKLNLQLDASGRFVFLAGGFVGLSGRQYDKVPDPPAGVPGSLMRAKVLKQFVGQHRSKLAEYIAQRCAATPKRIERVIDAAVAAGRIQLDSEGVFHQGQADVEDQGPRSEELPFEW